MAGQRRLSQPVADERNLMRNKYLGVGDEIKFPRRKCECAEMIPTVRYETLKLEGVFEGWINTVDRQ